MLNSKGMEEKNELPKAYEAALYEIGLYEQWEKSGYFNPDVCIEKKVAKADAKPFSIVLPPPNRTGTLHLGHATMIAIEDLMIRFHRMLGERALWIPGTDHAAISTQVKVEQLLIKEGMKDPRKELGRKKFLEKVVEFAENSKTRINEQMRRMGASCDWSRECYTLDEPRNNAVNEMFKMMYEDGIIERGYRVINWDPQFQTTLSDDEVLTKEVNARFITFKYDADFPIAISTTRAETKFGDTAVAVHPDDERYKKFVGKTFEPIFCGKKLNVKIIADQAVDPTFGTGALGVTPAHSMIDAEIAERHGLPTVQVINEEAKMTAEAGKDFEGLTVVEARKKVEKTLDAAGLLIKVEDVAQNLPIAERGGAPVEQLPMKQWFIRVNKKFPLRQDTLKWEKGAMVTLKELMIEAVASTEVVTSTNQEKRTKITPDRFEKTYLHWINNLRDWCISRQIWFGHQIPVWYPPAISDTLKVGVGFNAGIPVVSAESPGEGWTRDPDTLDTWFSSGMWTFSTLGWPKETPDLATYHPTSVLETGYDIIFFWVARMILMSTYALGVVPFHDVYLHGLVRDEQGRKMSKSLGNVIDPLDVSAKYGTDAVRLSLVIGTSPGQDSKMSEEKIAGFRNFTNKLWNIGRYVSRAGNAKEKPPSIFDKYILYRLDETIELVTRKLNHFQFSQAGELLRDFTWNQFADIYVEIHKEGKNDKVLRDAFMTLLRLWHPFMPFVTEFLWKELGGSGLLMVADWPQKKNFSIEEQKEKSRLEKIMESFDGVLSAIRSIRADYKVAPDKLVDVVVEAPLYAEDFKSSEFETVIKKLCRVNDLKIGEKMERPEQAATVTIGLNSISIPLAELVDLDKEKKRIEDDLAATNKFIASIEARLGNEEFVGKAPAKVVEGEKAKLAEAQEKIKKLNDQLTALGS
jgi:valyl-tRNA synthetase